MTAFDDEPTKHANHNNYSADDDKHSFPRIPLYACRAFSLKVENYREINGVRSLAPARMASGGFRGQLFTEKLRTQFFKTIPTHEMPNLWKQLAFLNFHMSCHLSHEAIQFGNILLTS